MNDELTTEELEIKVQVLESQLQELMGCDEELGILSSLGRGMTRTMATMLHLLIKKSPATISRSTFHVIFYADRDDGGPDLKIIDVRISRLRKALIRLNCPGKIKTIPHAGFQATPELVQWVRALYAERKSDAATI